MLQGELEICYLIKHKKNKIFLFLNPENKKFSRVCLFVVFGFWFCGFFHFVLIFDLGFLFLSSFSLGRIVCVSNYIFHRIWN